MFVIGGASRRVDCPTRRRSPTTISCSPPTSERRPHLHRGADGDDEPLLLERLEAGRARPAPSTSPGSRPMKRKLPASSETCSWDRCGRSATTVTPGRARSLLVGHLAGDRADQVLGRRRGARGRRRERSRDGEPSWRVWSWRRHRPVALDAVVVRRVQRVADPGAEDRRCVTMPAVGLEEGPRFQVGARVLGRRRRRLAASFDRGGSIAGRRGRGRRR